jgi:hypothetical protein
MDFTYTEDNLQKTNQLTYRPGSIKYKVIGSSRLVDSKKAYLSKISVTSHKHKIKSGGYSNATLIRAIKKPPNFGEYTVKRHKVPRGGSIPRIVGSSQPEDLQYDNTPPVDDLENDSPKAENGSQTETPIPSQPKRPTFVDYLFNTPVETKKNTPIIFGQPIMPLMVNSGVNTTEKIYVDAASGQPIMPMVNRGVNTTEKIYADATSGDSKTYTDSNTNTAGPVTKNNFTQSDIIQNHVVKDAKMYTDTATGESNTNTERSSTLNNFTHTDNIVVTLNNSTQSDDINNIVNQIKKAENMEIDIINEERSSYENAIEGIQRKNDIILYTLKLYEALVETMGQDIIEGKGNPEYIVLYNTLSSKLWAYRKYLLADMINISDNDKKDQYEKFLVFIQSEMLKIKKGAKKYLERKRTEAKAITSGNIRQFSANIPERITGRKRTGSKLLGNSSNSSKRIGLTQYLLPDGRTITGAISSGNSSNRRAIENSSTRRAIENSSTRRAIELPNLILGPQPRIEIRQSKRTTAKPKRFDPAEEAKKDKSKSNRNK